MRTFVTLADENYLTKLKLCLSSLEQAYSRTGEKFQVAVLALDDVVAEAMRGKVKVLSVEDLNRDFPKLEEAKAKRAHAEWCWTLGSVLLCYAHRNFDAIFDSPSDHVSYMDSDLCFFTSPEWVFSEMGDASIAAVPHRFPSSYAHYEVNGRYNVSMVFTRRDKVGRQCAERWAAQCIERCDAATCGDQKYLDEWPKLYGWNFHEVKNLGVGVAPWNVWSYDISMTENGIPTVNGVPVCFFHVHEWTWPKARTEPRRTLGYPLRPIDIDTFYRPYEAEYAKLEGR